MVDKDRIKGAAKEVAGEVEKQTGKLTGNRDLEAKGNQHKVEGKIDKASGHIKETLRGDK